MKLERTVQLLLFSMFSIVKSDLEEESQYFYSLEGPEDNFHLCFWECDFPADCSYGQEVDVQCWQSIGCAITSGKPKLKKKKAVCQYCYQTPPEVHNCIPIRNCSVTASPQKRMVRTICQVSKDTLCIGKRTFYKKVPCNWTSGYKWSTAFILSVTLGGFGADRFYLGLWQSGLGKLFSFGGLGVWTLIDVVLVGVGYIGPDDGSLFMSS